MYVFDYGCFYSSKILYKGYCMKAFGKKKKKLVTVSAFRSLHTTSVFIKIHPEALIKPMYLSYQNLKQKFIVKVLLLEVS